MKGILHSDEKLKSHNALMEVVHMSLDFMSNPVKSTLQPWQRFDEKLSQKMILCLSLFIEYLLNPKIYMSLISWCHYLKMSQNRIKISSFTLLNTLLFSWKMINFQSILFYLARFARCRRKQCYILLYDFVLIFCGYLVRKQNLG